MFMSYETGKTLNVYVLLSDKCYALLLQHLATKLNTVTGPKCDKMFVTYPTLFDLNFCVLLL